jgi:hypothetical protein
LETEGARELEKVMEWQILGAMQRFPKQFMRVHEDLGEGIGREQWDSISFPPF